MKTLIRISILVAFSLPVYSQIIYFSSDNNTTSHSDIFELDLSNCSFKMVCNDVPFDAFTIRPKIDEWVEVVFGAGPIAWINRDNCRTPKKWDGIILKSNPRSFFYGQTSDRYGNIWIFGWDGIAKVNPPSLLFDYKGPLDQSIYQVTNGGTLLGGYYYDIVFGEKIYKNERLLVAYDTSNPMISKIICKLPGPPYRTLFTIHQGCGSNNLIVATSDGAFYQVELLTGGLTLLCKIDLPANNSLIEGGASPWAYDPKHCDVFLDLDLNNSSGDIQNGFNANYSCRNDQVFLCDRDLDIFSDYGVMDSVQVRLLNNWDGNAEELRITIPASLNSLFFSKTDFSLYPSTLSTNDTFQFAISSLTYKNNACLISTGDRFIRFIVFKNGRSDTAFCTLKLNGPFYNAGVDAQISICENEAPIRLDSLLGSCHSLNGTWDTSTAAQGYFDPSIDADGIYKYVVGDTICGFDTASVIIRVIPLPNVNLGPDTSLCFGSILPISLPPGNYLWNDGSSSNSYTISANGWYWVESGFGTCRTRDSIYVQFTPSMHSERSVSICENSIFNYKNSFYHIGDTILDFISTPNQCDTILKIIVTAFPSNVPSIQGDTIVCPNQKGTISCINSFVAYHWSTGENTQSIVASKGSYTLTVTDQNNCQVSTQINIQEAPAIEYTLQAFSPLCPDDFGKIDWTILSEGIPPIHTFLNGQLATSNAIDNLAPGAYLFKFRDALGCEKIDSVVILVPAVLDVNITDQISLDAGSTVLVNYSVSSAKLTLVSWSPAIGIQKESDHSLRIPATSDVEYVLRFVDENGCELQKILRVRVNQDAGFYAPTLFSPNGDQINDTWLPTFGASYHFISCRIFDRWGQEVFYSTNALQAWDGKFHGQYLMPGVYVYQIQLQTYNGDVKSFSGDISLVR